MKWMSRLPTVFLEDSKLVDSDGVYTSGIPVYATFDLLPNPVNYPNLRVRVTSGIGIGGAELISDGTRWRYINGNAWIKATYSDILHTTDFSVEKVASSIALPINNGKSIMQDGDVLDIFENVGRTAYVTTVTRKYRFGTLNTTSDAQIETISIGTNKSLSLFSSIVRKSNISMLALGASGSATKWSGNSSSDLASAIAVPNMDSTISYLSHTLGQSANTNEAVALKTFMVRLNHTGL